MLPGVKELESTRLVKKVLSNNPLICKGNVGYIKSCY